MNRLLFMAIFHLNKYIVFSYKQLSQKNPDELNHREICVLSLGLCQGICPNVLRPTLSVSTFQQGDFWFQVDRRYAA